MSFLFASLRKDLARWRQDVLAILLWMSIPLVIGGLITSLMDGGGGAKPQGILLIADLDDTVLSGFVAGAYSQGELGELIVVEKVTASEGSRRINAGEASGFLLIPAGFTIAFLESTPISLTLVTNPSQTILPGIITDVTEILLDMGFYAEHLFGDEISQIAEAIENGGSTQALTAALTMTLQKKIESVATRVFPPVIDIEIAEPPSDEPSVSLALLFLPGIILMSVMFSANGLANDFWAERELGTLRRLASSPGQLSGFLAGKALAAGTLISIIGGLTLVLGFAYHGIAWARFPSSLVWVAISGIALFSWFGALQMIAASRGAANLLTMMFMFPLLMVGGSFFPFEALPDWLAAIGRMTPNGFMADRLSTEITASSAWTISLSSWLFMIAMALSGLAVCAWRLRSGFARGAA